MLKKALKMLGSIVIGVAVLAIGVYVCGLIGVVAAGFAVLGTVLMPLKWRAIIKDEQTSVNPWQSLIGNLISLMFVAVFLPQVFVGWMSLFGITYMLDFIVHACYYQQAESLDEVISNAEAEMGEVISEAKAEMETTNATLDTGTGVVTTTTEPEPKIDVDVILETQFDTRNSTAH